MRHLRCRFSRREASNQQHFLLTQNTLTNPAAAATTMSWKTLPKTAISSKFSFVLPCFSIIAPSFLPHFSLISPSLPSHFSNHSVTLLPWFFLPSPSNPSPRFPLSFPHFSLLLHFFIFQWHCATRESQHTVTQDSNQHMQ